MDELRKAEADLRRLQNCFWTGSEPLFRHLWRIELAYIKVEKLKLGQKDAIV